MNVTAKPELGVAFKAPLDAGLREQNRSRQTIQPGVQPHVWPAPMRDVNPLRDSKVVSIDAA